MHLWNRWTATGLVAAILLLCRDAWADGIGIGFIVVFGSIVLVPVILFTVLTEGLVLAKGLHLRYRETLLPLLAANLLSLAAGIPVKIFGIFVYASLPRNLAGFFRAFPFAAIAVTALFFVVTLVVEYMVIAKGRKRAGAPVPFRRMATIVLLANCATYAVLAPTHYFITRPVHNIQQFTHDSSWAGRPLTEIHFLDRNSNLCSVMTDGGNRRTVLRDEVKNFQMNPEAGLVLYSDAANQLWLYSLHDGSKESCWTPRDAIDISKVTFSPDGKWVARLQETAKSEEMLLHIYDVAEHREMAADVTAAGYDYEIDIGWSAQPDMLYLRDRNEARALTITNGGEIISSPLPDAEPPVFATIYGNWNSGWQHEVGDVEAKAYPGLIGRLHVRKGDTYVDLAVNPGLLHLSQRWFTSVCILPATDEVIFDDFRNIYLLDISSRKVGQITEGSRFITISERYSLGAEWSGK